MSEREESRYQRRRPDAVVPGSSTAATAVVGVEVAIYREEDCDPLILEKLEKIAAFVKQQGLSLYVISEPAGIARRGIENLPRSVARARPAPPPGVWRPAPSPPCPLLASPLSGSSSADAVDDVPAIPQLANSYQIGTSSGALDQDAD